MNSRRAKVRAISLSLPLSLCHFVINAHHWCRYQTGGHAAAISRNSQFVLLQCSNLPFSTQPRACVRSFAISLQPPKYATPSNSVAHRRSSATTKLSQNSTRFRSYRSVDHVTPAFSTKVSLPATPFSLEFQFSNFPTSFNFQCLFFAKF